MLNIDIFIKRLKEVMENHHLNAAGFAEKIGVQRSSVSHILSKRNKPSLDLILKIQIEDRHESIQQTLILQYLIMLYIFHAHTPHFYL